MIELHHGDCIEVMRTLPDNSVDSICTDPPYELSNDGKSSANRVFAEMVLPKDAHLKALACGEDVLPLFISKVLELGGLGIIPSPSATVPVGAVTLDNDSAGGDHDVVDGVERAVSVAGDAASVDLESEPPVHLGDFALKLADPSKLVEVVGKLGACFQAGALGVGLGVSAASFPREQGGGMAVVGPGGGVGLRNSPLADLVGAFSGAGVGPVLSLDLGRGAEERFTADGARVFAAILLEAGAELVRAVTPARGLPAVLESRRISVVDDAANRAFSFNLILHTQTISSVGFMGKAWDGSKIAYDVALWREALRVLKPGGHLLAFGGTRTWHRLAVAVEDAGFEIRDSIAWMYGSGFPKSHDVSKAIDKKRDDRKAGAQIAQYLRAARDASGLREADVEKAFGFSYRGCANWFQSARPQVPTWEQWGMLRDLLGFGGEMDAEVRRLNGRKGTHGEAWQEAEVTGVKEGAMSGWDMDGGTKFVDREIKAANSEAAQQWQGWGTALKPAFEPIVMARKPLIGTVAANVQTHGTGALNIDGCRIAGAKPDTTRGASSKASSMVGTLGAQGRIVDDGAGRWPANVALDEHMAAVLDGQSGHQISRTGKVGLGKGSAENSSSYDGSALVKSRFEDAGGASRFFYVAKAPKKERPVVDGVAHATVKPVALMRWLVRLVTPEGGTVLEPFAGSGTTVEACILEGFHCIAIEREAEYLPLIQARIDRQDAA